MFPSGPSDPRISTETAGMESPQDIDRLREELKADNLLPSKLFEKYQQPYSNSNLIFRIDLLWNAEQLRTVFFNLSRLILSRFDTYISFVITYVFGVLEELGISFTNLNQNTRLLEEIIRVVNDSIYSFLRSEKVEICFVGSNNSTVDSQRDKTTVNFTFTLFDLIFGLRNIRTHCCTAANSVPTEIPLAGNLQPIKRCFVPITTSNGNNMNTSEIPEISSSEEESIKSSTNIFVQSLFNAILSEFASHQINMIRRIDESMGAKAIAIIRNSVAEFDNVFREGSVVEISSDNNKRILTFETWFVEVMQFLSRSL